MWYVTQLYKVTLSSYLNLCLSACAFIIRLNHHKDDLGVIIVLKNDTK